MTTNGWQSQDYFLKQLKAESEGMSEEEFRLFVLTKLASLSEKAATMKTQLHNLENYD